MKFLTPLKKPKFRSLEEKSRLLFFITLTLLSLATKISFANNQSLSNNDNWLSEPATEFRKINSFVAKKYLVVTANDLASKAGAEIISKGGSAIDAAITAQMVLNVVEPHSSGIGGGLFNSVDVEFSKDLEHCFISAGNGVWRVDGLGSVYTSDANFVSKVGYVGTGAQATTPTYTTATKITTTNYEGIAVNPSDADDIVLFAGFNGTNRRSLNATSATPTYTALPSIIAGSQPACYDGIIDRDDSNIIVVGTSEGVFVTENGGGLWENASAGFEGTPVFEVRQSWRTFEEGNNRPGEIYIGTFGRGIWKTGAYLGVGDNGSVNSGSSIKDMITYPNPSSANTTLSFELEKEGDVMVSVYSISGALVKKIAKEKLMAGKQELTIDSETLNEGIYIIKMQSGQQSQSVTFVKM